MQLLAVTNHARRYVSRRHGSWMQTAVQAIRCFRWIKATILRDRWIWVDVFSASVLTTYAKIVEAAGGSFCRPPTRVPAAVEISSLCDQEKGTFGLVQTRLK
jgi:hypothetical protein